MPDTSIIETYRRNASSKPSETRGETVARTRRTAADLLVTAENNIAAAREWQGRDKENHIWHIREAALCCDLAATHFECADAIEAEAE